MCKSLALDRELAFLLFLILKYEKNTYSYFMSQSLELSILRYTIYAAVKEDAIIIGY